MSTETMIQDVELAEEAFQRKARGSQGLGRYLCLTLIFLLLAGATLLFCLLHFGVIGPQNEEQSTDGFLGMKPLAQTVRSYQATSKKPVAHVIANSSTKGELRWLSGVANILLNNGMGLEDNQLVVPTSGLYLVYSHLLFKGADCSDGPLILTHTISRFSSSYENTVNLLSTMKSTCQEAAREASPWYEPTYLGGVFQLDKGDKLSTSTNYPNHLDLAEPGQVYFGVVAL